MLGSEGSEVVVVRLLINWIDDLKIWIDGLN